MTKTALALAAALLAGSALTTSANAGGIRVGFGFPLGSFVAHSTQYHAQRQTPPSYGRSSYGEKKCDKSERVARQTPRYDPPARKVAVKHTPKIEHEDPPARKVVKHTPKPAAKVEVAEAPVRKVIKRTPKVVVAENPVRKIKKMIHREVEKPVEIQTAKLEDSTVVSDAAPTITVPETPAAPAPQLTGTQSTPAAFSSEHAPGAAPVATASLEQPAETAKVEVKTEPEAKPEPKAEKTAKSEAKEPKKKIELSSTAKRVCRRFSAAIAGLIDIPCE